MKQLIILFFTAALMVSPALATDNPTAKDNTFKVIKSENTFFGSIWSKIKRVIPTKNSNSGEATAVMGVRGAETTESALKPHWEGDLSSDSAFRNDMKQFEDGTILCESKEPAKGAETFEELLKNTNNDMLKANTLIALGACYAEIGDEKKGREHLQTFANKYPSHPMHLEVSNWLSGKK